MLVEHREQHAHVRAISCTARAGAAKADWEGAANEALGGEAEDSPGGGVSVGDLEAVRVNEDHGFGAELEEEAVAGLDVAHSPVIPLQRLLRLDQSLLERGDRAEISADGDEIGGAPEPHRAVRDRNIGTVAAQMIHLPPRRHFLDSGLLNDLPDLGLALGRHRAHPGPAHPLAPLLDRLHAHAERHVADAPLGIDQQRDVRARMYDCRDRAAIEVAAGRHPGVEEVRRVWHPLHFCAFESRGRGLLEDLELGFAMHR